MHYPGLPSHPQHKLAVKQMTGYSGMIAVEINGGVDGGKAFVEVRLLKSSAANNCLELLMN